MFFNGDSSSSRSRKYAFKRRQAWELMSKNSIHKSIELFSQISGYVSSTMQDYLIKIFLDWNILINKWNKNIGNKDKIYHKIQWLRAPFYSTSQLAYLHSNQEMLHCVFGGCDLLMFGCECLIININFKNNSFEITYLDQILYTLNLMDNPELFIDACLLSGFDQCRTFEPLTYTSLYNNARSRNFSFEYALDKITKNGKGISVIDKYINQFYDEKNMDDGKSETSNIDQILQHMLSANDDDISSSCSSKYIEYKDTFIKVKSRILNARVISFGGNIAVYKPFGINSVNNSNITYIDNGMFYKLITFGVLTTFVPSAIFGGYWVDTTPLIGSEELEKCMNVLLTTRMNMLCIYQSCFGDLLRKDIILRIWSSPNKDKILEYRADFVKEFESKYTKCLKILFSNNVSSNDCCWNHSLGILLDKDDIKSNDNNDRMSINDIYTLFRCVNIGVLVSIDDIGFNDDGNVVSELGCCLDLVNIFEYETLIALYMIMNEDLHEKSLTFIDENGKTFKLNDKINYTNRKVLKRKRALRLLSRLVCLLNVMPYLCNNKVWKSKLSHDLSGFNQISIQYFKITKTVMESIIMWLFSQNNITIKNDPHFYHNIAFWYEFTYTYPSILFNITVFLYSMSRLQSEPSIGMGVLLDHFVTKFSTLKFKQLSKKSDKERIDAILSYLDGIKKQFPIFKNIEKAIIDSIQFINQMYKCIKKMAESQLLPSRTVIQFDDAIEYLNDTSIFDAINLLDNHISNNIKTIKS